MTEDEVAARLKAQPGEVCGRVRADGAGRLIFADSLPAGRLRAGALPGLLLGGLLLAGEAEAGGQAGGLTGESVPYRETEIDGFMELVEDPIRWQFRVEAAAWPDASAVQAVLLREFPLLRQVLEPLAASAPGARLAVTVDAAGAVTGAAFTPDAGSGTLEQRMLLERVSGMRFPATASGGTITVWRGPQAAPPPGSGSASPG